MLMIIITDKEEKKGLAVILRTGGLTTGVR